MTDRVTTEQVIQRLNEIGDHELGDAVAEMQAAFRRCADDKLKVLEERDRLAAERDEQEAIATGALTTAANADARAEKAEAELARRDAFAGCDGCSTGDCPHDSVQECSDAQAEIIREQAASIEQLEIELAQKVRVLRSGGKCGYCGMEYDGRCGVDVTVWFAAHAEECDKHPVGQFKAKCDRLAEIVERFTALSVNAEPRYEDANGTCWAKPYEDSKPTRKVYLVDAAEFDKAAEAAAKGEN